MPEQMPRQKKPTLDDLVKVAAEKANELEAARKAATEAMDRSGKAAEAYDKARDNLHNYVADLTKQAMGKK